MIIQRGLSIIEAEPLDLRYQAEPGNEWNRPESLFLTMLKDASLNQFKLK